DFIQTNPLGSPVGLLPDNLSSASSDIFRLLLRLQYPKGFPGLRCASQSKNHHSLRRFGTFYSLSSFIEHSLHTSAVFTRHHRISDFQCSVLHQNIGYISPSFIQRSFYHRSICRTVRIGL